MTKTLNCCSFYPYLCVLQELFNGKVIGIGKESSGLYNLKNKFLVVAGIVLKNKEDSRLWHLRLGHTSLKTMKHIPSLENKVEDDVQEDCMICPLAKLCRLKFPVSMTKSSRVLELFHLDVWGPHKHPTHDRKHYFVTIVDDFSRYTWVCLLQSKVEVVVVMKDFISMMCNQFNTTIKVLRSDNGS